MINTGPKITIYSAQRTLCPQSPGQMNWHNYILLSCFFPQDILGVRALHVAMIQSKKSAKREDSATSIFLDSQVQTDGAKHKSSIGLFPSKLCCPLRHIHRSSGELNPFLTPDTNILAPTNNGLKLASFKYSFPPAPLPPRVSDLKTIVQMPAQSVELQFSL